MLCEKCKKNEAKINLVKIVNGEKQQIWLCEECAKNISSIPFLSQIGNDAAFPFQDIISGLISTVDESMNKKEQELVCDCCGMTLKEFEHTDKLGCPECYKVFKSHIKNKLKKNKINFKYTGRIPKTNGKELIQRNKLKNLKLELQNLIESEEYEKAAIVRDEIRDIELYIIKSSLQEEKCDDKLDS